MIRREDFRTALNRALERALTTKPEEFIGDDETFTDYGLDSLDQMNMLLEMEDEIGVEIGDVDIGKYNTLAKLNDYVNQLPN